ncbi:uncharacterized protein [Oryza sativa Japonica Group]|jgi:acylphosphatase|uniref:Acylphosphatase n=5 Tax=Oryza TaxID=4527 RepID=Q5Z6P6_ORYSJ|nr:uncharacterized protein LOC4340702 [Oryza sativa Japonica Group]XP_052159060.1 uncharacterized protein LOC127776622 [Oryza glaberrima]KAF2926194.1 hypothetical protein DAI22_06g107600 [Oryza sativa Japonica Group]BAD54368.1 hypothetical protein [Oryza sativa Japonica Group]BAD54373.1 hypothetical protein [Oryza sativa Japonica Group]BAF19250.2 Os06g0264600 [Oryza sativa Japonica Group]|eukprot:NP_001057336.2 Os06g0264600 [Oryza sativa Japonica Group]
MATPAADATSSSPTPSPPPQETPARKAVRVVVKGRVQGVGFRDWTAETAESLGLAGWVRNRRDGTVEALLSGDPAKVDEMVSRHLPVGSPASAVTAVVPSPADPIHPSLGFEINFTV